MQKHWFLNPYNVANWPDMSNFKNTRANFEVADFAAPTIAFLLHRRNVALEKTVLTYDNLQAVNDSTLIFICNEPVAYYHKSQQAYLNTFYIPSAANNNLRVFEFDTICAFLASNNINQCTVYVCDYNIPHATLDYYNQLNIVTFDHFLFSTVVPAIALQPYNNAPVQFNIACLNGKMHYFREQTTNHCNPDTTYVTWETWFSHLSTHHTNRHLHYSDTAYTTAYSQSAIALVNETRFFQPSAYISEKVMYAMLYKKPVLLAAPPRTLEYMQTLGFKTWGALWDERYDLIEDHETRLQAIKDIIDYIQSKTIAELIEMSASIQDILDHNYDRLQEIKADSMLLKLEI